MTIPLSLYIHIPWCVKKCPYCDFNSHSAKRELPEAEYIEKLLVDLEQELPFIWGRRIKTIFFGGGTPSLFSPNSIHSLLTQLHARLAFGPDTEITLEANPGTVDQKKFKALREAGINRLSLGIQSFQDEKLKQLGRIHGASEAHSAIQAVLAAGFENFNIDLMFGLPQQSLKDALFDLATAIQYQPTHLSWYQLTIEPNTYFAQFPPKLPKDESIWKIQQQGQALLNEHDYCQYEISAYSKQGFHCQHNRNYWEFGDYIGIGAGAHGKLTDPATGKIYRKWKVKHPKQYLTAEQLVAEEKQVLKEDLAFEFFLNAFRLYEAIPLSLMTERTGLTRDQLEPKLQSAQEAGLLQSANNNLTTTPLGKRFLNNLLEIFLNE